MPRQVKRFGVRRHRGAAAVEMAVVAPILFLLMFGVVELGLMIHSVQQVRTVAREGVREAAVGGPPSAIEERMAAVVGNLDPDRLEAQTHYRVHNAGGGWGAWTTLGEDDGVNDAPPGAHIRLAVTYHHRLAVPGLFGRFADNADGTRTLEAELVMRRE